MKMKKIFALLLAAAMMLVLIAACAQDTPAPPPAPPAAEAETPADTAPPPPADDPADDPVEEEVRAGGSINVWAFTDEIPNALQFFIDSNPDFPYTINVTIISDQDGAYEAALNAALMGGGADAPDMFTAEQAFVVNYTQFEFAEFALPYEELFGEPVQPLVDAAQIASFIQEAGTNPAGQLVGLGFQSTGSAFIYRRDLAEQIWGTDDPDYIAGRIGPGWDQFIVAAGEAAAEGIAILSGEGDAWQAIRQSPNPWIADGTLVIDAQRMSFLDVGYQLFTNDFTNKTNAWGPQWFADMRSEIAEDTEGPVRPVLGYLGPAWLINYVIAGNSGDTFGNWAITTPPTPFAWGGTWTMVNANGNPDVRGGVAELVRWLTLDTTDDGFQFLFANQLMPGATAKDAVASAVVMERSDGTLEFLAGQDMFDVFIPAGVYGDSSGWGPQDRFIDELFSDFAEQYFMGVMTRDEALDGFRQTIQDTLGIGS